MSTLARSYYVEGGIAWYEDGEEGAVVGQDGCTHTIDYLKSMYVNSSDEDERTYFAVEIAVAEYVAALRADGNDYIVSRAPMGSGWKFETAKTQSKALAVAKAALKAEVARIKSEKANKPWPEWALEAVKNGWKAPKGWKP